MTKELNKSDVYRMYVYDEMAKKTKDSIEDLADYVDSLDDEKIKKLCRRLSHSRKNGVFKFISRGPDHWIVKTVDISRIHVRRINSKVNGYLSRNKFLLRKIAEDEKIPRLKEFKKKGKIHKRSLYLLAHKRGSSYKLIDGNHRAVKLACDGKKEFKLILPRR